MLTSRDRWLCAMLAEHRVLTTVQIAALAFPSLDTAEHRLLRLHRLDVIDRFRPHAPAWEGSRPYHYVLGSAGAAVLAASGDAGASPRGWRRDRALAVARSSHLGHLVAVNGFFAALAGTARTQPGSGLTLWWSERRCASRWGQLARPDGYGHWHDPAGHTDFFLELDRATEPPHRLAAKLTGYQQLADLTAITTPVLFWLPTRAREQAARRALAGTRLPVLTSHPGAGTGPASPCWLPVGGSGPRLPLGAARPADDPADL